VYVFLSPHLSDMPHIPSFTVCNHMGWDSIANIVTDYGLDGPQIESRWGVGGARFFVPFQTGPGAHPSSCTMGTALFPGVKAARAWRRPATPI
jgi:hypothetical protein